MKCRISKTLCWHNFAWSQ